MLKENLVWKYMIRVLWSAPVIGAGILDALLIILKSIGLDIHLPAWGYLSFLTLGILIESFKLFVELEDTKVKSAIIVGIYHDNHTNWGDSITITYPNSPDFRPSFGFVVTTDKQGSIVKGISGKFTFYWRGETPDKSINLYPPKEDDRWKVIYDHIVGPRPATFMFNSPDEIISHDQPTYLPNLAFGVVEYLEGSIVIKYEVSSFEPSSTKTGEVVINLSKN